ncbi:MAG TPA: carcinine hydrolase/isopenicillin-N N-acyltransferase family protein [bacterium]|nr:carcinine hydrolase/isopenicillin-N N-acyltransferase family protein [bacterium]HPT29814.1 carcinine hydrolase/isopenicillin-N N-acyltransferase family protein [bacterium]
MCTLGAKKINNNFYIFKNRDREYPIDTRVVREDKGTKKLLIVDEHGHCEGINEHGIGLIEATLQPYPRVRHLMPSQIARKILDQDNITDILKIIESSRVSANMIVANSSQAFIIEKTPSEFAVTKLRDHSAITNLSVKLNKQNGARLKTIRDWARARYKRAQEIVGDIKSFSGIIKFLSDRQGYPDKSICSGPPWWITTKCSFIYDLKNKRIFFCKIRPDQGKFVEYKL